MSIIYQTENLFSFSSSSCRKFAVGIVFLRVAVSLNTLLINEAQYISYEQCLKNEQIVLMLRVVDFIADLPSLFIEHYSIELTTFNFLSNIYSILMSCVLHRLG